MTDFEKTYQNYNPRQAALDEARALLTAAAKTAMADGTRHGGCTHLAQGSQDDRRRPAGTPAVP